MNPVDCAICDLDIDLGPTKVTRLGVTRFGFKSVHMRGNTRSGMVQSIYLVPLIFGSTVIIL